MQYDIADRCSMVEGNFFESIPEGCDLYILKLILHDWDDDHSLRILKNCHEASRNGGRILIVENVILEDNDSSSNILINDIHMMVQTIGGRERTGKEYARLLNEAGFKPVDITNEYIEGEK